MHPTLSRRELFVPAARTRPPAIAAPRPILSAEAHVLARATFGATPAALAELQTHGLETWLEQQLDPVAIDDSAFDALQATVAVPTNNSAADIRLLARAVASKRHLAARMTHFLNNHFSTNRGDTVAISETLETELFAKRCFDRFSTLLIASAKSPAMIDFLDSASNIAGSPNENYARELMELHTLGVTAGYTEIDVREVAKVFTGWSRVNVAVSGVVSYSYFRFYPARHEPGPKSISLGWSTPGFTGNAGVNEGLSLLTFLANHPATAARITDKLCKYFVNDQPPAGLLARVLQVFNATGGSLKDCVRAIFSDAEFATTATAKAKVHDGFEMVANVARRLGFPTLNYTQLSARVGLLRCLPHQNPVPTGYPELGPDWQGAGNVLSRWDFAYDLANDTVGGAIVPWSTLLGVTPPTTGAGYVTPLLARLCDSEVPATTVTALTVFMDARLQGLPANPTWTQVRPAARALLSMILRLPESQLH
ncbi:MAG: DUF1800 domain-containing protein [Planctomycetota bacterium]